MAFENPKFENEKETLERKPEEKVLNQEEIEELGEGMDDYTAQLKAIIEEKKIELKAKKGRERAVLKAEIEELQAEYDGLTEFSEDIHSGNYEEITEKPYNPEK